MNEAQKKALRAQNRNLTADLDVTADLTSTWIHTGLFNEDMIEEITHEKTRKQRIQKLLVILPQRGPRAFDKFVASLNDHYSWLADDLRKTYHKISLHTEHNSPTEPEMMSLKKKVDIYVHERFGNSKRLCEDDKKEIRHFLYSYLKSHKEEEDPLFAVEQSRRNSLESNVSDIKNLNAVSEKDIEVRVLSRVYSMFGSDEEGSGADEFDCVDGPTDITMDMIEKKVNELNKRVDSLQNEINDCYTVLEVEQSEHSLHEVLEGIRDDRIVDRKRLGRLRDRINALEKNRSQLEEKIQNQQEVLNETYHRLAEAEHSTERYEAQTQELKEEKDKMTDKCEKLKDKCEKLEKLHLKHVEKQQTLMTLKSMVHNLNAAPKHSNDPGWIKSTDNNKQDSLQLPKLSPVRVNRQGRQSHAVSLQDRSPTQTHHHEFPKPRTSQHGTPWK